MGGVGAGGLRAQAVEAAATALGDYYDLKGPKVLARPRTGATKALEAAEPFLRAQVIAEVVEWLRQPRGQDSGAMHAVGFAAQIEREFGGRHAD